MKKFFLAAMAIATIAMVGCKPKPTDEPKEPEIKKTVPDVAATEGAVTIVWNAVDFSECSELVFAGSYNDYGLDPASMAKFEKIEGYTNWYKAVVTPKEGADPVLEGKPCALAMDGTFPSSWNHQWIGTEEHPCELISGDAEFATEYEVETKIVVKNNSSVIFVRSYSFKENPCEKAETYTINFTLNVAVDVPEDAIVAVVGDFPVGWNVTKGEAYEMTRVTARQFTATIENVALGKGYKYAVLNDNNDWANELYPTAPAEGDTCVAKLAGNLTISDVTVADEIGGFMGITTDLPFCEEKKPESVPAGHGTFVVTISNRTYAEEDVCIFTGNFEDKSWGDSDRNMTYNEETNTWSWEGDYPENFEYKVIYNSAWAAGDNAVFDGETYTHTFEIQ